MANAQDRAELEKLARKVPWVVPVSPPPMMPEAVRDAIVRLAQIILKKDLAADMAQWVGDMEEWRRSITVGQRPGPGEM